MPEVHDADTQNDPDILELDDHKEQSGGPGPKVNDDGWGDPKPLKEVTAPKLDDQTEDPDKEWEDTESHKDPDADPEDPKARVPSFRVREIREKAEKERKELADKVTAAETRATSLEAELKTARETRGVDLNDSVAVAAHVRSTDEEVKKISGQIAYLKELGSKPTPENLKILAEAGITTNEDWQALLTELTVAREARVTARAGELQGEHRSKQEAAQHAVQQARQAIVTSYDKTITESKIPDMQKFLNRVLANATKLNEGIRWAILGAEDADSVTAAVGSNRKLFDELASYPLDKKLDRVTLSKIAAKLGREGERFASRIREPVESVVDTSSREDRPASRPAPTAIRGNSRPARAGLRHDEDGTLIIE